MPNDHEPNSLSERRHSGIQQQADEISQRLAAIVDSSDDAIISKDLNGIIQSWNRGAERIFGYSAAEMIGQPLLRLLPPDRLDEESQILNRLRRGEKVDHFETVRVRKDGQLIDISVTISPIQNSVGHVIGASKVARDITDRKKNAAVLCHQIEEVKALQDFFDNANLGLHWVGADGTILRVNRAELELLGYTSDEYIAHNITEFHADLPVIQDILTRLLRDEKLTDYEARLRCKDGSIRIVQINSSVYRVDGKFIHTRCFTRDVTERKQLMEQMQLMQFCIDHSGESVFWCGRDGRLLYVNNAAALERGYSVEEMLNSTIFDLDLNPEYQPEGWADHFDDLKRQGTITLETTHCTKDGRVFPVEVKANYVKVGDHEFNFASVRDITERTQKDERLRQNKDRLEQLSRELIRTREAELQKLAGALHDDIGQMLTAMKINLSAIKAKTAPIDASSLDTVVSLIDQTNEHVRNLAINMSPPQLEYLGLVPALEWYLSGQGKIAGFGWKVIVKSDEIQISKDLATTCYRIAQESVTNAVRHAIPKSIVVELQQEDEQLLLTIRDDGVGFDVSTILQNTVVGKSFGLTNMQERARLMGGHVEFESAPLKGTAIRASFPLTVMENA